MPRFFFHLRKGEAFDKDAEGRDLAESEALSDEAVEAARDLLAEGDRQGLDRRGWVFEIADETGGIVLGLPFADAIEPDVPPAAA